MKKKMIIGIGMIVGIVLLSGCGDPYPNYSTRNSMKQLGSSYYWVPVILDDKKGGRIKIANDRERMLFKKEAIKYGVASFCPEGSALLFDTDAHYYQFPFTGNTFAPKKPIYPKLIKNSYIRCISPMSPNDVYQEKLRQLNVINRNRTYTIYNR